MLMKTKISLACLAVMLMATAGGAWAQEGRPLTFGEATVGSLDTIRRWFFEAEAGQAVRVTAESAGFDTMIEIVSSDGEVLAANDDCSSLTTDSCLEVTIPLAGRYEIRVSAFMGAGTGFYTVAVQQSSTATSAGNVTALVMDTASPGRLGEGDQAVGRWSFDAEAGQPVRVTAESAAFDTVLTLLSAAGEVLGENDDCSSLTTDSCLEMTIPLAGRYEIRVGAFGRGGGAYEVAAHIVGAAPPPDPSAEPSGAPVVGELQQDDPAYVSGEYYDQFTVEVGPGETLMAEVQSDAFETHLVMTSPSEQRTSRSGATRHGRSRVRLEVSAAEPGVWRVNVTSALPGETGAYRLWLDVGSSGPTLVHGTLEDGDAEGRGGEYVDVHRFEARDLNCSVRLRGQAGLRVRVLGSDGYHAEGDAIPVDGDTVVLDDVLLGRQHRVLVTGAVGQTGDYTLEIGAGCSVAGRGPEAAAGQTYGLFVGISDYGGRASDLPRTADDARRLAGTLVNAGVLPAGNAIVLTDQEATVEGLTEAIEGLGSQISQEDRFVLFYSGHAGREPVVNPEAADPDGKDETLELFDGALRDNEVNDLLSQIEAGLTLVALDTCFAGGFAKELISVPGRMGLFSSEEDGRSLVSPRAGGYLSQFLMDAVAGGGADADGDGAIRAIELRQYLHERFRTDVKGSYDDIVWGRGPAYQHLQVDPGSVRPTDVIFHLQAMPVSIAAAEAQTLGEIVGASLEATGGREAMARVESVRQAGTLSMSTPFGDLEGSVESIIIPNQRLYQRVDLDVYGRTTGWNGVAAWQSDDTQGVTDLTGPEAAAMVAESSLHPFWDYGATGPDSAEFSRRADADLAGRNHHVVQVSRQGVDSQVFVDADTMLVSRIQITEDVPGMGAVTVTGDRYDYEEHGGVLWPLGNRVELPGALTIDARVSVVEVNGEVNHLIFERP